MKTPSHTLTAAAATALAVAAVAALSTTAHATGKTTLESNEALGLGDNGTTLRIFELNDPEDDDLIGEVTGLAGQQARGLEVALIGIDYRAKDDTFYGVGELGGIYTLNTKTGAATLVSTMSIPPEGEHFGVDFDPNEEDVLRIVSDTRQILEHRLGTRITTSEPLHEVGSTGIAHTNNDTTDRTITTLIEIHAPNPYLVQQTPTQDGNVYALGSLGLSSVSDIVGFDIQSKISSGRTVTNTGYASLRTSDTAQPDLYKIDLLSGKATKVDDFDKKIADIAVKQP